MPGPKLSQPSQPSASSVSSHPSHASKRRGEDHVSDIVKRQRKGDEELRGKISQLLTRLVVRVENNRHPVSKETTVAEILEDVADDDFDSILIEEARAMVDELQMSTSVQAFKCNELTDEKLRRFGMTVLKIMFIPQTSVHAFLKSHLEEHTDTTAFYFEYTKDVLSHWNRSNESGCRVLINTFLQAAAKIHEELQENKKNTFIFTEVPVQASAMSSEGKQVQFTGKADYLIKTFDMEILGAQKSAGMITGDVLKCIQGNAKDEGLLVCEAKTEKTIVQGVAQAAGLSLAYAINNQLNRVRFIVTNGGQWMFGILRKKKGEENAWAYQFTSCPDAFILANGKEYTVQFFRECLARLMLWMWPEYGGDNSGTNDADAGDDKEFH